MLTRLSLSKRLFVSIGLVDKVDRMGFGIFSVSMREDFHTSRKRCPFSLLFMRKTEVEDMSFAI